MYRTSLKEVLSQWDPDFQHKESEVRLGFAYMRRLARDDSLLALDLSQGAHTVKSKGKTKGPASHEEACQGCPACCGPDWHFKTEIVAILNTIFCE